jgi:aryl-alcohol dehydrogenase-like predicted oxidoreductase
MSDLYGPADDDESIATIHAALDAGITLLDTGDFYAGGHNELLLARAIAGRDRDKVVISVTFGVLRGPDGRVAGIDARPAAVRNFLAYTLRRLGPTTSTSTAVASRPERPDRGHGRCDR